MSAGMEGKDLIWDFFMAHRLVRAYDLQGNLMSEIEIEDSKKPHVASGDDRYLCFDDIAWSNSCIAVLYNDKYTWNEYCSSDDRRHECELQLWTWDGELKRRVRFDRPFDIYALSDDNIFYAMEVEKPGVIYTYDFSSEK